MTAFKRFKTPAEFQTYNKKWQASQLSVKQQAMTELKPGEWCPLEIIAAPATPEDIRNLSISASASAAFLRSGKN